MQMVGKMDLYCCLYIYYVGVTTSSINTAKGIFESPFVEAVLDSLWKIHLKRKSTHNIIDICLRIIKEMRLIESKMCNRFTIGKLNSFFI